MRMRFFRTAGISVAALLLATNASAQIVQSVHLGAGMFFPRGFDSRNAADVLVADLTIEPVLDFDVAWFRSIQYFGEWNVETGNHLEFGVGASFYRVTDVFSHYRFPPNGQTAGQILRLRIVPIMAVVRFFLFGTPQIVRPFIGGGVGVFLWSYGESGSFIDTRDNSSFTADFAARGTTAASAALFGVRIPVQNQAFNIEWRYQFGVGKTGGLNAGFLGDKIDLSGGTIMFGFVGRF
jgi:hypothetical protein